MNVVDLISLFPILYLTFRGWQKGIVRQVIATIGIYIAILASLKCTHIVLEELDQFQGAAFPLLAHVLVFLLTLTLVHLIIVLIEKALKFTQLNFINRLAGALLGLIGSLLLVSLLIWILDIAGQLTDEVKSSSIAITYFSQWSPFVVEITGKLIPIFEDLPLQIELFFSRVKG